MQGKVFFRNIFDSFFFWTSGLLQYFLNESGAAARVLVSVLSVAPRPPYIFSLSFSRERKRMEKNAHLKLNFPHMCTKFAISFKSLFTSKYKWLFLSLEKYIGEFPYSPLITVNFASLLSSSFLSWDDYSGKRAASIDEIKFFAHCHSMINCLIKMFISIFIPPKKY